MRGWLVVGLLLEGDIEFRPPLASVARSSLYWRIIPICSGAPDYAQIVHSLMVRLFPNRRGVYTTFAVLAQHTHLPRQAKNKFPAPASRDQSRLSACMMINEGHDILSTYHILWGDGTFFSWNFLQTIRKVSFSCMATYSQLSKVSSAGPSRALSCDRKCLSSHSGLLGSALFIR